MDSCSLTSPSLLDKCLGYYNEVNNIYRNIFMKSPLFGDGTLEYNGKKIIFDKYLIQDKEEIFWHLISFDPSTEEEKFTVAPCNNMSIMTKCLGEKSDCDGKIILPYHDRLKNRVECYYRMQYIKWIEEIIILANMNDPRIEVWQKNKKNNRGAGYQTKVHIRFKDVNADYLIVLNDLGSVYKLITAFPITLLYKKKSYSRDYKKYKK